MENVLVTGGAGYIGSHMIRVLLEHGYQPVVFDNLSKGYREFVPMGVPFIEGDIKNHLDIEKVFDQYPMAAVMHFAGSIVVPESVAEPLKYYETNVGGTLNLLRAMENAGIKFLIVFELNIFPDQWTQNKVRD